MGATRFNPYTQFNAQAVSSTTVYTSASTDINQAHNIGLDIRFTGTMVGTLTVNCSNDNVVFTPLTFSPALSQPNGSNLNMLIDLNQVPYRYIQVQYTNASGSGTLTSLLTSKDLA
jgi:hypothetical protein